MVGKLDTGTHDDLYLALLRSITGQQLSVKAAQTIWQRFLQLFPEQYPHPRQLLKIGSEKLRSAGLSGQKAGYLLNIAAFSLEKQLEYEKISALGDEELIAHLTQIKGVGRWTAEMVLMFTLGRPDVFPVDDLGIVQGIQALYKVRARDKKSLVRKLMRVAEPWKPYRTLACMYIWRSRDMARSK